LLFLAPFLVFFGAGTGAGTLFSSSLLNTVPVTKTGIGSLGLTGGVPVA
jgi:hypothetical protein